MPLHFFARCQINDLGKNLQFYEKLSKCSLYTEHIQLMYVFNIQFKEEEMWFKDLGDHH